jgi:carbonic anhydrase
VAAAISGDKMPTANLQAVVNRISPAITGLKGNPKSPEYLQQAVEANVLHCSVDFLANSPVVLRETAANNVEIIKAVYSLETGQVRRLTG